MRRKMKKTFSRSVNKGQHDQLGEGQQGLEPGGEGHKALGQVQL
jgi:hypothetical protein